jgi:hypothetical protein
MNLQGQLNESLVDMAIIAGSEANIQSTYTNASGATSHDVTGAVNGIFVGQQAEGVAGGFSAQSGTSNASGVYIIKK